MTPDQRTRLYLITAHVGGLAALFGLIGQLSGWTGVPEGPVIIVMTVTVALLLLRGLRDEYIEGLWHAGASWAFVTIVAGALAWPYVAGFWNGFSGLDQLVPYPALTTSFAAIFAFFAGFHWRWLKGGR